MRVKSAELSDPTHGWILEARVGFEPVGPIDST